MKLRCSAEHRKHFPGVMLWKETTGKGRPCFEAEVDPMELELHGLVLHWTHDGWRIGKIHTEHGWEQIGVGKQEEFYAIVLRRIND